MRPLAGDAAFTGIEYDPATTAVLGTEAYVKAFEDFAILESADEVAR